MTAEIDPTLYPDIEPPDSLESPESRADYMERVCAAFDFGVPPEESTLELLSTWKGVFDRFPYRGSPAYHALRALFGWEEVDRTPYFGTPYYRLLDRRDERDDGCEDMV